MRKITALLLILSLTFSSIGSIIVVQAAGNVEVGIPFLKDAGGSSKVKLLVDGATDERNLMTASGGVYAILNVELRNAQNAIAEDITDGGRVSKVSLVKTLACDIPAKIIVAVYDNRGVLQAIEMADVEGTDVVGQNIERTFNTSFGQNTRGYSLRVLMWEDIQNITPLAEGYALKRGIEITKQVSAIVGQPSVIVFAASGVLSFADKTFIVTYDPTAFTFVESALAVTASGSGWFEFEVDAAIPSGNALNGSLSLVKFKGLKTTTTAVVLSQQ
jgi:hypothetical protein